MDVNNDKHSKTPVMTGPEEVEAELLRTPSGPLRVCKYLEAKWSVTGTFTYLGLLGCGFEHPVGPLL